MESNFQTSFIPKKPVVIEHPSSGRSIGFFTIIALFLLLFVILATVGLYLYKGSLVKNIAKMENDLTLAKNRFEASKITELKLLDKRLTASTEILGKHIAVTPIFQTLSAITMKTVQYTKFSYDLGSPTGSQTLGSRDAPGANGARIVIKMSGMAAGYRSVALQSDLFTIKDEGKNLIDPVFSNLTLDDKGNVLFDLEFSVDPSFVDYKRTVEMASLESST